jgi:hypothetical protein
MNCTIFYLLVENETKLRKFVINIAFSQMSSDSFFVTKEFPLAPMGVLASHLRMLDGSARPPIDILVT